MMMLVSVRLCWFSCRAISSATIEVFGFYSDSFGAHHYLSMKPVNRIHRILLYSGLPEHCNFFALLEFNKMAFPTHFCMIFGPQRSRRSINGHHTWQIPRGYIMKGLKNENESCFFADLIILAAAFWILCKHPSAPEPTPK